MKKILLLLLLGLALVGCTDGNPKVAGENTPAPNQPTVVETTKNPNPREKIKIEYFFDFQCEYCQRSFATMDALKQDYGSRLEVHYYHYPTKPGSSLLAEAAECARDQDQFFAFQDEYLTHHFGQNDLATIRSIAQVIQLDQSLLVTCLESGVKKSLIESDMRTGRKYGLTAVPFFVVGDQPLTGSYPKRAFDKIIRHELTK